MLNLPSPALIVLVGAAASGKSTWASEHFSAEQVISTDELRGLVGQSTADQAASADAFEIAMRMTQMRLGRKLTTVFDSTGLDDGLRAELRQAAAKTKVPCIAIAFDTPRAACIDRNRERRFPVPQRVIANQFKRFQSLDLEAEEFAEVRRVAAPATPKETPQVRVTAVTAPELPTPAPELSFGLSIPSFQQLGDSAEFAVKLTDITREAEQLGFVSVNVMDHLQQIPSMGRAFDPLLESHTTLSYLAAKTERIILGSLVTAVTLRHPAILAKQMATLDVLSGGRARCGIGAAWFEHEHEIAGVPFPPLATRYELLEDALQTLPRFWGPGKQPFSGHHVQVSDASMYPRPVQERIPIMVGGVGPERTLLLAAKYADMVNLPGPLKTVRAAIDALHQHCDTLGRDRDEVEITSLTTILTAASEGELHDRLEALRPASLAAERYGKRVNAGVLDQQIERFSALAVLGVREAIISVPALAGPGDLDSLGPLIEAFAG